MDIVLAEMEDATLDDPTYSEESAPANSQDR